MIEERTPSREPATAGSADSAESSGVVLEGLDGGTPLGFLAGLGVQRVLADRAGVPEPHACGLSWSHLDAWRPVLHGPASFEAIVEAVHEDASAWSDVPILAFRYLKMEKKGPKRFGGLRAPVAVLRQWLVDRRDGRDDTSLAYACALMCESASTPKKEPVPIEELAREGIAAARDAPNDRGTLPTFFDFTSRNVQFLDQVTRIRESLERDVIEAELRSGQRRKSGRSMGWDPAADTPGAIYTGYTRGSLAATEWLAFRGLVYFPVTGVGERLQTTACAGRRLNGTFVWPLWEVPAGFETVRSLLSHPGLEKLEVAERQAFGIAAILRAELTKQADGYTGMFSPAQPV